MNVREKMAKLAGRLVGGLLVLCISGFGAGPCWASTYNFFPTSSAGDGSLGTSAVYGPITIYGLECDHKGVDVACLSGTSLAGGVTVDPAALYTKNDGATERGLGIANDPLGHNEISNEDFLNLDLSNLGATLGTMTISSLQLNESFMFCYGNSNSSWNSNNCSGGFTGAGSNVTVNFNLGAYKDISLIGVNNDVLLSSMYFTTRRPPLAPEPGTLSLFGTGLLGLCGIVKRRLQTRS